MCSFQRNLLRRLEKTGRSEDLNEELDEKRCMRLSEHSLVDGTPGVQAKEVGAGTSPRRQWFTGGLVTVSCPVL